MDNIKYSHDFPILKVHKLTVILLITFHLYSLKPLEPERPPILPYRWNVILLLNNINNKYMSVILSTNLNPGVSALTMKDGDIAVVLSAFHDEHVGTIVTRYDDHLVALGQITSKSWRAFFSCKTTSLMVRILQPGEQLTIV